MATAVVCSKSDLETPFGNGVHCPSNSAPAATSNNLAFSAPFPVQLVQALTWARTKQGEVLQALHERRQHYKGKDYYPPERQGRCIVTKEGTAAVDDAIAYVQALDPMGGVGSSSEPGLALAAEDHIADIGVTGTASHSSSDGTGAADRALRYGNFTSFGECLWYGSTDFADARTIVLDLIVDDGVQTRGHRKGIYNPAYDTVGAAYGPHSTFGSMAALEFARGWEGNVICIQARMQTGPVKMSVQVTAKAKAKANTQWALGICHICSEPIKGGKVVEVPQLGGKLHMDCFKCSSCAKSLAGGAFKVQSRAPYCTDCFFERFGEKCTACGEVITGSMMRCSLGVFHAECVVCATCGKAIGKAPSSSASGALTCQHCATGSRSASRPGTPVGRSSRLGNSAAGVSASALSSAGGAIMGVTKAKAKAKSSAAEAKPKSRASSPRAKAKTVAKPAARPASMGMAKTTVLGLGADYAGLG